MMKWKIGFTLLFIFFCAAAASAQGILPTQSRSISVSGEADVKVVPDEITFTLGVETTDKNLRVAKTQNDEIVKKALAVVRTYAIPNDRVQTDYLSIYPERQDYRSSSAILAYVARKTIVVRLRDIAKYEDLLSDLLETGVTNVHGIEFRALELKKYRDRARELAIKAAQEKAEKLASGANSRIGKTLSIYEYSYTLSNYNGWWGANYAGRNQAQVVWQQGSNPPIDQDSSIALGVIVIRATVNASFELL